MAPRPRLAAVAAICALAALAPLAPARAASNAPPKGSPEQRQTVSDLRNVGTAMFVWYQDQKRPHGGSAAGTPAAGKAAEAKEEVTRVDFQRVPVISRQALAELLVPKYLAEVPEKDGWGHPYEYRLQTADLAAKSIMALRSAGRDGRFSGDTYAVGPFPAAQEDEDIPWMDGYFVCWPSAK